MTLKEWADLSGLTWTDIALLVGCSTPYPGMVARGKAFPSWKMAKRFEEISNGLVPKTNWYPDNEEPIGIPREHAEE